jgi:hypothetical protein
MVSAWVHGWVLRTELRIRVSGIRSGASDNHPLHAHAFFQEFGRHRWFPHMFRPILLTSSSSAPPNDLDCSRVVFLAHCISFSHTVPFYLTSSPPPPYQTGYSLLHAYLIPLQCLILEFIVKYFVGRRSVYLCRPAVTVPCIKHPNSIEDLDFIP